MSEIKQITYEEAMKRFRHLYRMEKLPHEPVANAEWYASEFTCGALVWIDKNKTKARIKGTVTTPEYRGHGYGEALVLHRIAIAEATGAKVIEVYARHPNWYLKNGFEVVRDTGWGVIVLRKKVQR